MTRLKIRRTRRRADPNARYHAFLRRLRAGGRSNMYGAIPYLAARFELDRETAFRIICDWIDRESADGAAAPARREPIELVSSSAPPPTRRRPTERTAPPGLKRVSRSS